MGTFLQMSIIDDYNNKMKPSQQQQQQQQQQHHHHIPIHKGDFDEFPNGNDMPYTHDHLLHPTIDYRDVIILRNIYDSIISGYLYHLEGKECWLDWYGNDRSWDTNLFPSYHTKRWMCYIDILSQRTRVYDTLCHCLANSTEEDGIRVYIDWVFHAFYGKTFEFWALSS